MKVCINKECNFGGLPQPESNFSKDKSKEDCLCIHCKECEKERKRRYKEYPSKLAIRRRKLIERINKKYKLKTRKR